MALSKNSCKVLRSIVFASLGILAGVSLFGANAFADACSDTTNQYNSSLRAFQSSKFQFPQDCPRARDYFFARRQQAQSLAAAFDAAKLACGAQFGKDRPSPDSLVSLLEHEAVTLETGCDLIAGVSSPPATPPQPLPAAVPAPAPTPAAAPAPAPPAPVGAAPVGTAPPPSPPQTAPPPANQSAVQSCAAQRSMPVAPGCSADFPQRQTGAACAAADNSVGLTLQVPGGETTCCVTSCARSK